MSFTSRQYPQLSSAFLAAAYTALGRLPPQLTALRCTLEALEKLERTADGEESERATLIARMSETLETVEATLAPAFSAQRPALLLDPAQIATLREEGLLESLTALFEEMARRTFVEMQAAARAGNSKALADAAHLLKGSAVNFGAAAFAATCHCIEQQAATASPATLEALLCELEVNQGQLIEALHRETGEG